MAIPIVIGLLLASEPVNAPSLDYEANGQAMQDAWADHNANVIGSLIPGVGAATGKVSTSVAAQVGKEVGKQVEKAVVKEVKKDVQKTVETSKAARREAMREAGIPTSQPLIKDKATNSKDKVFLTRDKKHTVQDAKNDVSHQGQPHWEAGPTKKDPNIFDGLNRSGSNNKPQMTKTKVYYEEKCPSN